MANKTSKYIPLSLDWLKSTWEARSTADKIADMELLAVARKNQPGLNEVIDSLEHDELWITNNLEKHHPVIYDLIAFINRHTLAGSVHCPIEMGELQNIFFMLNGLAHLSANGNDLVKLYSTRSNMPEPGILVFAQEIMQQCGLSRKAHHSIWMDVQVLAVAFGQCRQLEVFEHAEDSAESKTPLKKSQTDIGKLYHLVIELKDCYVKVGREFIVPAGIRLDKLHDVIQDVMGWLSCHLYVFHTAQGDFGFKDPDDDDDLLSDKSVTLADIVTPDEPVFYYEYDMGDSWEHTIEVKSFDYNKKVPHPIHCLKAKGTCPPEDIGGTGGYENFCEIISNPKHPEYDETLEWLECSPDEKLPWPNDVSLEEINENLHCIEYKLLRCTKRAKTTAKPKTTGKYVPYEDKAVFVEQEILDKIMALPPTKIQAALMDVVKAKIEAGLSVPFSEVIQGKYK